MAEWSMATDCKSVGGSLRWFKSNFHHHFLFYQADLAQQVEHIHGKDGVPGSSPGVGSRIFRRRVIKVADIIGLTCTQCKRRNYTTTINKKKQSKKLEVKKYCKWCKASVVHKESK